MIKNTAGQSIGAQMIDATTGAAFAGTVTVYITGDAGAQAIGSVGSGICTAEGNGYYTYLPATAETNYDLIAFTFIGTGAIPATIQVATLTAAQQSATSRTSSASTFITVLDLITRGLFDLKVYQSGESLSPDDAELGRVTLNDWLDGLATENLSIYTVTRTTWTLSTATSYTIGAGATINVARPVSPQAITDIGYQDTSQSPTLEMLFHGGVLSQAEYDALPQKTLTGTYPQAWYYNPTYGSTGYGTLTPWPAPTSTTLQGVIYSQTPVSEFAAVTDTVSLPPGYRRFLRTNVAVELASAFDVEPSQTLMLAARESKANIKRANMRMIDLGCGDAVALFGGPGRSNFYAGTS